MLSLNTSLLLLTALPTSLVLARHHRPLSTTGTISTSTYTASDHANTLLTATTPTTPPTPPTCPTITTLVQRKGVCPIAECRPQLSTLTTTFGVGCGCASATPTVTSSVCLEGCFRSTHTVFEDPTPGC